MLIDVGMIFFIKWYFLYIPKRMLYDTLVHKKNLTFHIVRSGLLNILIFSNVIFKGLEGTLSVHHPVPNEFLCRIFSCKSSLLPVLQPFNRPNETY
jgi:hypothetical protein